MFKSVHHTVWVFDVEWVPDPEVGRRLYRLPEGTSDSDVLKEMWRRGGANEENPTPYLKTAICRVVSISAVTRSLVGGVSKLRLLSLPRDSSDESQIQESHILETFLNAVGRYKPQLVGYNSSAADIKILVQRGIASGIQAAGFCQRPSKPWEGVDYFARGSDYNVDLLEVVGGWGRASPSLNEMVSASGIPGKISGDGNDVAAKWLEHRLDEIIAYNEFDAITTYLLWLRMAFFGGFFDHDRYRLEQEMARELLTREIEENGKEHLSKYLSEWERVRPTE